MKITQAIPFFLFISCSTPTSVDSDLLRPALHSIQESAIRADIQALSSDEMQGRAPASPGEEMATNYIAEAFAKAGLDPVTEGEGYFQKVPLVGIDSNSQLLFSWPSAEKSLPVEANDSAQNNPDNLHAENGKDFMAWTKREVEDVEASGDLVFVGYGSVAPEFYWDDYKGLDCKGKILVMLVNDPPLKDESKFGGRAMTYYGRWTYKFEIGAKMGAEGVLLIHRDDRAGYPWEVVSGSWAGEQFDMVKPNQGVDSVMPFEGWISYPFAQQLFRKCGMDLTAMEEAAASQDFRPVPLKASAAITIKNKLRNIESKNVLGVLRGSHPSRKNEYVIYTAHWDHLGIGPERDGDGIYNGAIDNATGVAGLIALVKAFSFLPVRPDRSIVFFATTAEEQGLLGSKYYSENPLLPLNKTLAVINMDAMNVYGRTRDVVAIGLGNSSLDEIVTEEAFRQGRTVVPDLEPEKGYFYRSDHFPFAKKGVPALYAESGSEFIGESAEKRKKKKESYLTARYHKPQDEFDPEWDYRGMIDDLQLLFRVGYRIAQEPVWPEWKNGAEFQAIRKASLRQ